MSNIMKGIIQDSVTINDNGCWIWNGYVRRGYATIRLYSELIMVHRLSYELWKEDVPDGLIIRHKCDVASCVNPDHLEKGTHKDNTNDMILRGRNKRLCRDINPASKLTQVEVDEVVRMCREKVPHREISEKFSVSRTAISRLSREANIHNNPRKLSEEDRLEIVRLRKLGMSRTDLSNKYGVSISTIGRCIWMANKSK